MSDRRDSEKEKLSTLSDVAKFNYALKQFQSLIGKTVAQKREERLGMYIKDQASSVYIRIIGYAKVDLLQRPKEDGDAVTLQKETIGCDCQVSLKKTVQIFGYFIVEGDALASQLDEENMVFLVSRRQRITKAGVKRRDVIKCIAKVPQLDFMITASQKGTLTIFNSQMRALTSTNIADSSWVTGCDYLTQLKRVVAVTERTVVIWDYKSQGSCQDNCFIIKPMEHCLLCVCTVNLGDQLAKDDILMGDDGGHVNLFTVTSDDFGLKQSKAKKKSQLQILDSRKFKNIKRKLHDDWVVKVKFISVLNCFGSCSLDSVHSFVLDDLKRLEDNIPVREFSVPRGVNAFTYCGKANIIVTGGDDKVLRLWHPNINTKPVGKLLGHLFSVMEIVTNEKDQHIISLSTAKVFRVWDIQTLSLLQIFHDSQGKPAEMQIYAMIFDNNHGTLITGSSVIDIYPLTRMIQDTKQVPQTHERNINVLAYNRAFHQVLTVCAESIVKVWELESGHQIYQIEDAHGPNIEVTCAAIDKNGFHLATGAYDGTLKIWDFGSGQEIKALPVTNDSKDDEQWLLQLVYLKASESRHVILALEHSGKIQIIQGNEGEPYLTVTWELPEAVSLILQGNPVMSLCLKPNARKVNGFFPDVQLLSDTEPKRNNEIQNLPLGEEMKCFDVLKVEGYSLIATGNAHGAIILWDFESATVRYLDKTCQACQDATGQVSGVNAVLFLFRSDFSSRCADEAEPIWAEADYHFVGPLGQSKWGAPPHIFCLHSLLCLLPGAPAGDQVRDAAECCCEAHKGSTDPLCRLSEICPHAVKRALRTCTGMGDLLREVLPFTKHPAIPLTALCTDISSKMLLAATKEGHIMRWNTGSFLEDPQDENKQIKQQLYWRAHSTKVVSLFYEEEKNLVVTASVDGSVRLWHAPNGHYVGYFGQRRVFELSESSDLILPCDVNEFPIIIKEDSKYMEKKQKFEYPLILDRKKWKSLTKSSLLSKKPRPFEVDQDFKFFKALASPKVNRQPLESFKSGNKEAGVVFGSIPIYRGHVIMSSEIGLHPGLLVFSTRMGLGSDWGEKDSRRLQVCAHYSAAPTADGQKANLPFFLSNTMGIHGLLQFIKEAAEPTHVKKYKGQVVAVDTYCWLHKGAYACAEKLAKGEPTDQYVVFCLKLVDMLLSFGIKPILVFDGCTLPSKKEVEKARREKRQANLLKGKQLLREGKLSEARDCFGRSVNVTHAMAHEVIKVFLKIDKFGNGLEIDQARLGRCKQLGDVFTEEKFRYMCILSGCDYLPSLHGIGLAKACKLLKLASNPDIIKFFCHATSMVDCTTKNETAQPSQDVKLDCQAQETKSITEDPVPQCSETGKFTRTTSSSPVETQRSCFSWSGSLGESPGTPSPSPGVLLLQQFHRQRNSQRVSQGCEISRLHTVSNAGGDESDEESSPLLEMECSLQSQGSSELSESSLDFSRISQVSNKDSEAEESDSTLKQGDDPSSQSSPPFSTVCTERKHTLLRSKVPGLQRSNFVRSHVVTKLKPLMPAKVSGLSKKLLSAQKKNHHNAENKPGLQVTISDLWKNFQFRRDSEKLPSCKKSSDPLSPIKDNIQLTPETEEEIFNQLEYSHVQRAIFQ
ncbi:WD repeat-containing protein 64 [Chelonia mydas]|uniref:Exonuclease 1 n=1 Tax=Chelonia mydas TaxID=8469 RepID=M7BZJ5_CHEMY|nr:WD repeat-containing protein 64 [Chelonia mydas]